MYSREQATALDMAVVILDGVMTLRDFTHPPEIGLDAWPILCRVRLHLYRQLLSAIGFSESHIERFYSLEVTL